MIDSVCWGEVRRFVDRLTRICGRFGTSGFTGQIFAFNDLFACRLSLFNVPIMPYY